MQFYSTTSLQNPNEQDVQAFSKVEYPHSKLVLHWEGATMSTLSGMHTDTVEFEYFLDWQLKTHLKFITSNITYHYANVRQFLIILNILNSLNNKKM